MCLGSISSWTTQLCPSFKNWFEVKFKKLEADVLLWPDSSMWRRLVCPSSWKVTIIEQEFLSWSAPSQTMVMSNWLHCGQIETLVFQPFPVHGRLQPWWFLGCLFLRTPTKWFPVFSVSTVQTTKTSSLSPNSTLFTIMLLPFVNLWYGLYYL